MPWQLSKRDRLRLEGVHHDLMTVVFRAADTAALPFMVLEGVRTMERQQLLLKQGATTTLNSRHLTGHAVDLCPLQDGKPSWHWPHYHRLAPIVFAAAEAMGVPIEWGGHWVTFPDGPHWQLPWAVYPA